MNGVKCKTCGGNVIPNSKGYDIRNLRSLREHKCTSEGLCEQLTGMFNRGNRLLMRGEYDKAYYIYERFWNRNRAARKRTGSLS